jgi:RHS repeat-associated protein
MTLLSRICALGFVGLLCGISALYAADSVYLNASQGVNQLGAFTQQILIETPPGVAGMKPALALSYNSHLGNGLVGKGWSISGLSSITRCGATVAQDGYMGGVTLSATDRFCLDGVKLLAVSGAYGANGTEYRTELESFERVYSYTTSGSDPDYFVVKTRSGETKYYGYDPLLMTASGRFAGSGNSTRIIWALAHVVDLHTNYVSVSYTVDSMNGQLLPMSIKYTGNTTDGELPHAEVTFEYETRPDNGPAYRSNAMMKSLVRLNHIKTFVDLNPVLDYQLSYEISAQSNNSLLAKVCVVIPGQPCSDTGDQTKSLLPISFAWNAPNGSYAPSVGTPALIPSTTLASSANYIAGTGAGNSGSGIYSSGVFASSQFLSGDFNGDGATEFAQLAKGATTVPVCMSTGGGTSFSCTSYSTGILFTSTPYAEFLVGDFDGDGLSDVAQVDETTNSAAVCYSNGDGQFTCQTKTLPGLTTAWTAAIDADGDGRTDFVQIKTVVGTSLVETCFSKGRGNANDCHADSPSGFTYNLGYGSIIHGGDYDGDGVGDWMMGGLSAPVICYSNKNGTYYCETKGTGTPPSGMTHSAGLFVGDFNGDGNTDFTQAYKTTSTSGFYVCLSSGKGLGSVCSAVGGTPPVDSSGNLLYLHLAGDVNGDGRADLIFTEGTSYNICYAISNGDFSCTSVSKPAGAVQLAGNFTGTGSATILTTDRSSTYVTLNVAPTIYPDVITSVTSGLGATTGISYAPLTDANIYQKGSGASFPTMDVQNSAVVVSALREPDGTGSGGVGDISYHYAGAELDLTGRGFLGFASVTQVDSRRYRKVETEFNRAFPYTGRPSGMSTSIYQNSAWSPYKSDTFTYGNSTVGGVGKFVYLSQQTNSIFDFVAGGSAIATSTTANVFDSYGNLTSSTVTSGEGFEKVTTNTYNNITSGGSWYLGQLLTSTQTNTDPDATTLTRSTAFTYSSSFPNQQLTEQMEPGGSDYLTRTYTYDVFGNRISVSISGSGMSARTTTIAYDPSGRFMASLTNPYSQVEYQTYDPAFGLRTSRQDINGLTTTWTPDALGRLINEARPDGTQSSTTFSVCISSCGSETYHVQRTTTTVAAPSVTIAPTVVTYFDVLDREYKRSTGGFNESTIWQSRTFDNVGRLASISRNRYSSDTPQYTKYSYDFADRITGQVEPDRSATHWVYSGLSTTIIDRNGRSRSETRDQVGQTTAVTDALGHVTQYKYDPFGNLLTTTDSAGNKTLLNYDVMGRKIGMKDPDTGSSSYTYNGAGELLTQTDAKGQTITVSYDLLGRMVSRQSAEFTGTWTYDTATHGVGKLASVTNSSGFTKAFTYDAIGRPTNEQTTLDTTYSVGTSYDSSGRLSQLTYPSGFAVTYVYDSNGYLREVRNSATSSVLWQRNSQNADNLPLQETLGNGVVSTNSYFASTGRLSGTTALSGTVLLQDYSLAYDYLGNVTARSDLINHYTGARLAETYTYDSLHRLTSVRSSRETKRFGYDPLGNLISKTDVGNMNYGDGRPGRPVHAVMSTNGPKQFVFTYDANGNMLTGAGRAIAWTSFDKASNISNSANSVTFSYGPDFERYKEVQTTCADYLGNASSTCIKYMVNPRQDVGIHFEKETNGSITTYRNFLYAGPGKVFGVYTTRSDGTSNTRYFHRDHLGSVVLSTYDNGAVAERLSYDAHGKRRNVIGTDDPSNAIRSVVSHQGFTDHEMMDDGGLGLINMNGRIYDPLLGRFLSADPFVQNVRDMQSFNRYSYVSNNPLSATDPSGHLPDWLKKAGDWAWNNILKPAAIVTATILTAGVAAPIIGSLLSGIGLGSTLAGLGTATITGALAGAVAGGLSSTLLGGQWSAQAVGLGAMMGGLTGGLGHLVGAALRGIVGSGSGVVRATASIVGGAAGSSAISASVASLYSDGSWGSHFMDAFKFNLAFGGGLFASGLLGAELFGGGVNDVGGNGMAGFVQSKDGNGWGLTLGPSVIIGGGGLNKTGYYGATLGVHEFGHSVQFMGLSLLGNPVATWGAYLGLGALSPDILNVTDWWERAASSAGKWFYPAGNI